MSVLLSVAVALAYLHLSSAECTNFPIRLPATVLMPNSSDSDQPTCLTDTERQSALNKLNEEMDTILEAQLSVLQGLSFPIECPGNGWIKIADFNLEDNAEAGCLGNWVEQDSNGILYCTITQGASCQSVNFPTNSVRYSKMCGRVKAYQLGTTTGFFPFQFTSNNVGIDDIYLDGVSITHGMSPRQHIWSYASGASSALVPTVEAAWLCPCVSNEVADSVTIPPFVNGSYYCDSGTDAPANKKFYYDNPLWDGQGCAEGSKCCAKGPYFNADFEKPTCDEVEVRICTADSASAVNVGVSIIELYVK